MSDSGDPADASVGGAPRVPTTVPGEVPHDVSVEEHLDEVPLGDEVGEPSLESAFEGTIADLERVTAERDDYLDTARRLQAEFENYKRRVETQRTEQGERIVERLVAELLPVLDACDAAMSHGAEDVEPIRSMLRTILERLGLTAVDGVGVEFDPNVHEAVLSEPADDSDPDAGPSVAEVMRTGYLWKGRTLRAAMVRVRG